MPPVRQRAPEPQRRLLDAALHPEHGDRHDLPASAALKPDEHGLLWRIDRERAHRALAALATLKRDEARALVL